TGDQLIGQGLPPNLHQSHGNAADGHAGRIGDNFEFAKYAEAFEENPDARSRPQKQRARRIRSAHTRLANRMLLNPALEEQPQIEGRLLSQTDPALGDDKGVSGIVRVEADRGGAAAHLLSLNDGALGDAVDAVKPRATLPFHPLGGPGLTAQQYIAAAKNGDA